MVVAAYIQEAYSDLSCRTNGPGIDSASNRNEYQESSWGERAPGRPARKAHNPTALSQTIVWKMWGPRRLTTLWVSTAYYRESFTFLPSCQSGKCLPSIKVLFKYWDRPLLW
jgi:hypothetical protein